MTAQRGAALKFAVIVLAGWFGGRVSVLFLSQINIPNERIRPNGSAKSVASAEARRIVFADIKEVSVFVADSGTKLSPAVLDSGPSRSESKTAGFALPSQALASLAFAAQVLPNSVAVPLPRIESEPNRKVSLTGSSWLLIRGGQNASSVAGIALLGGSQIGGRFRLQLPEVNDRIAVSVTAGISAPLNGVLGKEATVGLSMRHGQRIPITASIEHRFGLDKIGRNAVVVLVTTGVSDLPIARQIVINGYVEAGVVGLHQRNEFVDGSLSASRVISHNRNFTVGVGAGIWGAAQPGSRRIDSGPVIDVRWANRSTALKVSAQWRFRLVGDSLPGSGPALSIGTDF